MSNKSQSVDERSAARHVAGALKLLSKNHSSSAERLNHHKQALNELNIAIEQGDDSAKTLYYRASIQFDLQHFEEALEDCSAATLIDPRFAEHKGRMLYTLRRFEEALEAFTTAATLSPDEINARIHRASCLLYLNRYQDALQDLEEIGECKADRANVLSTAFAGMIQRPLDLHQSILQAAMEQTPGSPLHAGYVRLLLKMKRFAEALDACNKALERDPDSCSALSNKAVALTHLGKLDEALICYESATKQVAATPLFHANNSEFLLNMGFNKQARSIAPAKPLNSSSSLTNRSFAYLDLNDAEASLQALARLNQSQDLLRTGRPQEAAALCDQAIAIDPACALAYSIRSYARFLLNETAAALDDSEQSLKHAVQPAVVSRCLSTRASIFARIDRAPEALDECNRAVKLARDSEYALVTRGMVHAMMGNYLFAMRDIELALTRQPNFADGHMARARALLVELRKRTMAGFVCFGAGAIARNPSANVLATPQDALAAINKAIEINAENPDYYCVRYLIRKEHGDQSAEEDAARARKLGYLRPELT